MQIVLPLLFAIVAFGVAMPAAAFQPTGRPSRSIPTLLLSMRWAHQHPDPAPCEEVSSDSVATTRRKWLSTTVTAWSGALVGLATVQIHPASATYSAYSRREQDWQDRVQNGEVQYSSAKSLRKQLADIAPMNSERSQIFCPNGPSSAVTPLMENRCSDRLAMPSVYGRTEDVVGNSIPGFQPGYSLQDQPSSLSTAYGFGQSKGK